MVTQSKEEELKVKMKKNQDIKNKNINIFHHHRNLVIIRWLVLKIILDFFLFSCLLESHLFLILICFDSLVQNF